MLRVLHLIYDDPENPWLGGGGAWRVREIYRRLGDAVDVTVATGNYPGAVDGRVDGVRYRRLGSPRSYEVSRSSYVALASRLLRSDGYDVAVYDYSVYTPLWLPRNRPVGTVVHMLQGPTAKARWGSLAGSVIAGLEKRLIAQSQTVCVTSHWLRAQIDPLLLPGTKITRVGSGVPDELFEVQRGDEDYLLFYGRFDIFHKGLDVLLDAYARVRSVRPTPGLRIAGRGKDLERILPMATERGVADAVELINGVDESQRAGLLSNAIMLLHPSRLEGLPMVPAESMAAGTPVIATDVGAVREVVDPPAGGVLIPPDDAVALASMIRELLDDDERRRRMSATARDSAARFRWDRVAMEHLEFLQSIPNAASAVEPE